MELIHTLVIAEKPDAAGRIARAIDDDSSPQRRFVEGIPVFECHTKVGKVIVSSALGHLYMVVSKSNSPLRYYPVWDHRWSPKNIVEKRSAKLARWIRAISSLAANADRFVNACDYDVEGAVIGYTLLRYAMHGADKKAQRMKFSTMTEPELQHSFNHLAQTLDRGLVNAGLCRHELDWLYGINLSRLLTQSALKQGKGYATLSSGRVQGPTLKFVVDREHEIGSFVPVPFWRIDAIVNVNGIDYEVDYEKDRITSLVEAKAIVNATSGQVLRVSTTDSWESRQQPPHPFDLASLQSEAFRIFHYTPTKTLALAEKLYLNALISYPRTSSQKLPPDIGYSTILGGLGSIDRYSLLVQKLTRLGQLMPNQGPKNDPAHPAIYPTGQKPSSYMPRQEMDVFDLIVRRFMSTFSTYSLRENSKITLQNTGYIFFLLGSRLTSAGWQEFYKPFVHDNSREIPSLHPGDEVPLSSIEAVENFTQPQPRYNPSSLLRKMEQENVGTKATRAEIINILYQRLYIKGDRIRPTQLAIQVVRILSKYCPLILDPVFTARLDQDMENIEHESTSRNNVLRQALNHLRPVMLNLMNSEFEIGQELSQVVVAEKASALAFTYPCPICSSRLRIIRSRASGKRFIGCTGWPNGCKFTLPLPQYGQLKITDKSCKVCGFQMVEARTGRRRPLVSCPNCYKNSREPVQSASSQKAEVV